MVYKPILRRPVASPRDSGASDSTLEDRVQLLSQPGPISILPDLGNTNWSYGSHQTSDEDDIENIGDQQYHPFYQPGRKTIANQKPVTASHNEAQENGSEVQDTTDYTNEPKKADSMTKTINHEHQEFKKSWKAPVFMVSGLLLGLGLAIAHHSLNASLNNKPVDPTGGLSQQWTSRYATGLAFLIKTCFVTCVGTAFVQRQWLSISTHQQPIMVKDIDTLFNGRFNVLALFAGSVWLRNPLLWLLAVVAWTIPFAVIVTPATLAVEPMEITNITMSRVPEVLYNGTSAFCQVRSTLSPFDPSPALLRMVSSTVTTSEILSMSPYFSNQSYTSSFSGPALKCKPANESMTARASDATNGLLTYLAWTGDSVPWINDSSPFEYPYDFQTVDTQDYSGIEDVDGNSLWILSRFGTNQTMHEEVWPISGPINLTECRLYDASYNVDFEFENLQQTTTIRNRTFNNPVWLNEQNLSATDCTGCYTQTVRMQDIIYSYKAVMSAFGSFLVGADKGNITGPQIPGGTASLQPSKFGILNISWVEAAATVNDLEQLFQNITISLLSVDALGSLTIDPVPISVSYWPNTYIYESRDLILAYGLAFLFSLLCCIVGLHSFFTSKNSYQNNFSSFIRAVEGSDLELRSITLPGDTGADPLPKQIGEKVVTMRSKSSVIKGEKEYIAISQSV